MLDRRSAAAAGVLAQTNKPQDAVYNGRGAALSRGSAGKTLARMRL